MRDCWKQWGHFPIDFLFLFSLPNRHLEFVWLKNNPFTRPHWTPPTSLTWSSAEENNKEFSCILLSQFLPYKWSSREDYSNRILVYTLAFVCKILLKELLTLLFQQLFCVIVFFRVIHINNLIKVVFLQII